MTDEEEIYFKRQEYWQDQAINQLSNANSFMLTISVGLLAFCFDKNTFFKIKFCIDLCKINWSLTFHFFSLIFLTFAIIYGMAVLVTRLYDFRITRNITLTRQRFHNENKNKVCDENPTAAILPDAEFVKPRFKKRTKVLFKVILCEIDLLTKKEALEVKKNEHTLAKFNYLREFSFTLGTISWRLPRFQAFYLGLATILYILSLWIQ
jgi:hypothetical protein